MALKVFERNAEECQKETEAYRHLNSLNVVNHAGAKVLRKALDSFQITTAEGSFGCLVHPPLGMSLHEFRTQLTGKVLSENIVKLTLMHLLLTLDYLHTEAGIVHAGECDYDPLSSRLRQDSLIIIPRPPGKEHNNGH